MTHLFTDLFFENAIGLESFFDRLTKEFYVDHCDKSYSYPPYDIRKDGDKIYLEIALAGFSEKELNVEVKDSVLTVSTNKKDDTKETYIRKGIGKRAFTRNWNLGEYVVVKSAKFKNGILKITMENEVPEEKKPVTIPISI